MSQQATSKTPPRFLPTLPPELWLEIYSYTASSFRFHIATTPPTTPKTPYPFAIKSVFALACLTHDQLSCHRTALIKHILTKKRMIEAEVTDLNFTNLTLFLKTLQRTTTLAPFQAPASKGVQSRSIVCIHTLTRDLSPSPNRVEDFHDYVSTNNFPPVRIHRIKEVENYDALDALMRNLPEDITAKFDQMAWVVRALDGEVWREQARKFERGY